MISSICLNSQVVPKSATISSKVVIGSIFYQHQQPVYEFRVDLCGLPTENLGYRQGCFSYCGCQDDFFELAVSYK
uniref:Uncharacterized protein n=1 Tax=Brassica oleracea TaxID=3712 RepID=A0A3P6FQ78_BRAOL|nr:unnamed protein product [Brassica oleracea]